MSIYSIILYGIINKFPHKNNDRSSNADSLSYIFYENKILVINIILLYTIMHNMYSIINIVTKYGNVCGLTI